MGKNLSEWLTAHLKPIKMFQGILEQQGEHHISPSVGVHRPPPRPMCTICTDSLGFGDVSATRCGHVYHEMCLQRWLVRSGSCPQCRKPVCRSTLVRKLYFNFDEDQEEVSEDSGRHVKMKESESGDVRVLQEWLHAEHQLAQDLEKLLEEERARYRLSRLFCCELKEAIRSGSRRETQVLKILQREVTELRLFASSFKSSCDNGTTDVEIGTALRQKMDQLASFLERLRHRECHSVDFFFRRIWHLLDNIQRQSLEVRELRLQLEKTLVESGEQERKLKDDRDKLYEEMGRLRTQLNSALQELQEQERHLMELAADNTSLTLMLNWQREQSLSSIWLWIPQVFWDVRFWRRWLHFCQRIPLQAMMYIRTARNMLFPRFHEYCAAVTREEAEFLNFQRATLCGCISVFSFYSALWLNLSPGLVLFVTSIAAGLIAQYGTENNYTHLT